MDFRRCGFGDFDEIRGCLETVIFNLRFEAVPKWRPPSEVTDDTDDITREAKTRRLTQMLTANMRREYEQTNSSCAGWKLADRRAAFEWLVALPNGLSNV